MSVPDPTRRGLLAWSAALALGPLALRSTAAAAPPDAQPVLLTCTREGPRRYGVRRSGAGGWALPLPGRGHGLCLSPDGRRAVAFARRPGRFAVVVDPAAGTLLRRLDPPPERSFAGHGRFTPDGAWLITSERDERSGAGRLGVWEAAGDRWQRSAEWSSGGLDPHDLAVLEDGRTLAVANGGILTLPQFGRAKLNLPSMSPGVSLIALASGRQLGSVRPAAPDHQLSTRHLAALGDGSGRVAVAMQWEGPRNRVRPLLALTDGARLEPLEADWAALDHYTGSVAVSDDGRLLAASSPRGNAVVMIDLAAGGRSWTSAIADVCGLAAAPSAAGGFMASDGWGGLWHLPAAATAPRRLSQTPGLAWDNHALAVAPAG